MSDKPEVCLEFLADLSAPERSLCEAALRLLGLAEHQLGFSKPAASVLDASALDPTRDTFAVLADGTPVGIGVLQLVPGDPRTVVLRGFSVDPRRQGQGIGTRATAAAVEAAARRFSAATTIRLTVHVDNEPGRRAYERCGFRRTGEQVVGRAGPEDVMTRPLRTVGSGS